MTSLKPWSAGALVSFGLGAGSCALLRLVWPRFLGSWLECLTILSALMLVGVFAAITVGWSRPEVGGRAAGTAVLGLTASGWVVINGSGTSVVPALVALLLAGFVGFLILAPNRLGAPRFVILSGVAFLAVAWLAPALFSPKKPPGETRVVVIGLDGATWTILDEMMAEGRLPNLARLKASGSFGVLWSDYPLLSPPAWTSVATGKLPSKHGVQDFFSTQNDDLKTVRLWDILEARGSSIGLFRWLVTWPPDPIDPFVVPAWMARDSRTHPPGLSFIKELELAFQTDGQDPVEWWQYRNWLAGYLENGLRLRTALKIAKRALTDIVFDDRWEFDYAAKRQIFDYLNSDTYLKLVSESKPRFTAAVFYGSDNLAHKFWKYRYPDDFGIPPEGAAPFENLLFDYYHETDALVGELLSVVGNDATVFVVSDHGYSSFEQGSEETAVEERTLYKPRMERLSRFADLKVPEQATVAAVATQGYVTFHGSEEEKQALIRKTIDLFGSIKTPGNGMRLLELKATPSGQLEVTVARSITNDPEDLLSTAKGEIRLGELLEIEDRAGTHSPAGILIASGPNIRRGGEVDGARLVDITPTILHLLRLPVGRDMDGKVLVELLDEAASAREVRFVGSYEEEIHRVREEAPEGDAEAVKKELKALGYLN